MMIISMQKTTRVSTFQSWTLAMARKDMIHRQGQLKSDGLLTAVHDDRQSEAEAEHHFPKGVNESFYSEVIRSRRRRQRWRLSRRRGRHRRWAASALRSDDDAATPNLCGGLYLFIIFAAAVPFKVPGPGAASMSN